jgi:hypothetical protein
MSHFFTLNPRYERYELGVYPLEYKTVYGAERPLLGATLMRGTLFALFMSGLFKFASFRGVRNPINPTLADGIILITIGATAILAITTEIINFFRTLRINRRYDQLVKNGALLEGEIINIREKEKIIQYRDNLFHQRELRGTYYVVVTYRFATPERQVVTGEQVHIREDLRDKSLPPTGTPIRVLYVDYNTHVML